jgi:hypothetical protein
MSKSWKIRHKKALVQQTKPPVPVGRLGLETIHSISQKERLEMAAKTQRHKEQFHQEFRREARREPERQSIDRTPLECEVIAKWSRRMYFEILKAIRGKPTFCLIPQEAKQNEKIPATSIRASKRSIGSFAELAQALCERSDRANAEV